jgi:hypothetical protein
MRPDVREGVGIGFAKSPREMISRVCLGTFGLKKAPTGN